MTTSTFILSHRNVLVTFVRSARFEALANRSQYRDTLLSAVPQILGDAALVRAGMWYMPVVWHSLSVLCKVFRVTYILLDG
jgi:hypothetical protein